MPRNSTKNSERQRKAEIIAEAIARGHSGHSALKKAGFSDASASKGLARTFRETPNLAEAVERELKRWIPAMKVLPIAQVRAGLARTRLVMNVLQGKDRAVQSIKLLGQDREVNMWEPEVRIGMAIAVSPPAEWRERYVSSEPGLAESSEPSSDD